MYGCAHGGSPIAGVSDGGQVHVMGSVIHCTEEYFVYVMRKAGRCFYFQMSVELRDREIVFLRSIANSVRSVDHWILALGRFVSAISVQEREC